MAETLRYGEENLQAFPDNTQGLITAEAVRDLIVSTRSGGMLITEDAPFTAPMTSGVPTLINPLLPSAEVLGVLWTADANNRAYQQYAVAIPTLTIPAAYRKYVEVTFKLGVEKAGAGEDTYLFQIDLDGTPVGGGVYHTLTSDPVYFSLEGSFIMSYDVQHLIGLSVTPQGTGDDIEFESFQMLISDDQLWSAL